MLEILWGILLPTGLLKKLCPLSPRWPGQAAPRGGGQCPRCHLAPGKAWVLGGHTGQHSGISGSVGIPIWLTRNSLEPVPSHSRWQRLQVSACSVQTTGVQTPPLPSLASPDNRLTGPLTGGAYPAHQGSPVATSTKTRRRKAAQTVPRPR